MYSLTVHTVCTKEDYQQIEKKVLPRENKEEKRKVIIVLVQRRVRSSAIEDDGGSAASGGGGRIRFYGLDSKL